MKKYHYRIRRLAAVIIGLVFFVAGVFKLMDPVGAKLVVDEYLNFFHMGFLKGLSMPIALFLALLEALTGAALVTGVYRLYAAISAAAMIGFFTVVTFILWIFNPQMDCGCFGEVVHLTHGQTLLKNIVLLALAAVAFIPFKEFGKNKNRKYIPFCIVGVSTVALMIYSLLYIPLMDYTPFNLSSRLKAASADELIEDEGNWVATYIYEKNGQEGTFTLDRLPDSTWTFVRSEMMEVEDNIFETDFPELAIRDSEGNYVDSLAAGPMVLAVSVYDPSSLGITKWKKISSTLQDAATEGFQPLLLVAMSPGTLPLPEGLEMQDRITLGACAYSADYKTLVSLNRSNGGATYFNDGNLIEKWGRRNLPGSSELGKLMRKDSTDAMLSASSKGRLTFQAFFLYTLAIMFLI